MDEDWQSRIRVALESGDESVMRTTYDALIADLGAEVGGRIWLEVISGWDHSAVTG